MHEIKVLTGKDESSKARQLLEAVAKQVQPIMRRRQVCDTPCSAAAFFAAASFATLDQPDLNWQVVDGDRRRPWLPLGR